MENQEVTTIEKVDAVLKSHNYKGRVVLIGAGSSFGLMSQFENLQAEGTELIILDNSKREPLGIRKFEPDFSLIDNSWLFTPPMTRAERRVKERSNKRNRNHKR